MSPLWVCKGQCSQRLIIMYCIAIYRMLIFEISFSSVLFEFRDIDMASRLKLESALLGKFNDIEQKMQLSALVSPIELRAMTK